MVRPAVLNPQAAAWVAVGVAAFALGACAAGDPDPRTAGAVRAERRAYDGAPPVAPHQELGITCTQCHNTRGMQVAGLGFAPPSPHELTDGMSASSRCQQCHVFQRTTEQFVANTFAGLRQDLRHGRRLNDLTPPVMPHKLLMRENCSACHTGAAAREEIRTSHPERPRCMQCHVPQETTETFATEYGPGS